MRISRRVLLGAALAGPLLTRRQSERRGGVRLVDLEEGCALPESLSGFQRYLAGAPASNSNLIVIPGAGAIDPDHAGMIVRFLDHRTTVLLECQSATALGIENDRAPALDRYHPYVEYTWPAQLKLREFMPAWFRAARSDSVIATFAGRPVGLRRRLGKGTLIVLGSALGPMFLAGDQDAGRWLEALQAG